MTLLLFLLFLYFGVDQSVACATVNSHIISPKGRLCGVDIYQICNPLEDWSLANVPYFPMELMVPEVIRFDNSSVADIAFLNDEDHFNTCNFTNSVTLEMPLIYDTCGGTIFFASPKYCKQGLKVKVTWVSSLCDTVTVVVGTNGLNYTSQLNWINDTVAKPAITIPRTSKVMFNYTEDHDVAVFQSEDHYKSCNFTGASLLNDGVFCAYKVRNDYATGQRTFYLGSSKNQDCIEGRMKLQVNIAASNVAHGSLILIFASSIGFTGF